MVSHLYQVLVKGIFVEGGFAQVKSSQWLAMLETGSFNRIEWATLEGTYVGCSWTGDMYASAVENLSTKDDYGGVPGLTVTVKISR